MFIHLRKIHIKSYKVLVKLASWSTRRSPSITILATGHVLYLDYFPNSAHGSHTIRPYRAPSEIGCHVVTWVKELQCGFFQRLLHEQFDGFNMADDWRGSKNEIYIERFLTNYHSFYIIVSKFVFFQLRRVCIKDMRYCFSQKAWNSLNWLSEVEGFEMEFIVICESVSSH